MNEVFEVVKNGMKNHEKHLEPQEPQDMMQAPQE